MADFSFRVQAATKSDVKQMVSDALSAKGIDRKVAIATCNAYVDLLDDAPDKDYAVSASGSVGVAVGTAKGKTVETISNVHLSLSALCVERA